MSRDNDDGQLHLATLTRLWNFDRHLYRIGDKPLANPINLRGVAWAILLVPTFWVLSTVLLPGTPLSWMGLGLAPRLMVPIFLVAVILTKLAKGAQPWEVLWSWTRLAWHQARHRPKPHRTIALRSRIRTTPTHVHDHTPPHG